MGPAFMLVTQPKPWSLGLKAKQVWSVLGSDVSPVGQSDGSATFYQLQLGR